MTDRRARGKSRAFKLTDADAAVIKGMLEAVDADGDPLYLIQDISAYFGVNAGRVSEIRQGIKFRHVKPEPLDQLPPPGPYIVVTKVEHQRGQEAMTVLRQLRELMDQQFNQLEAKLQGEGATT